MVSLQTETLFFSSKNNFVFFNLNLAEGPSVCRVRDVFIQINSQRSKNIASQIILHLPTLLLYDGTKFAFSVHHTPTMPILFFLVKFPLRLLPLCLRRRRKGRYVTKNPRKALLKRSKLRSFGAYILHAAAVDRLKLF